VSAVLKSKTITVDGYAEAVEYGYTAGWSDGLPIVPPTDDRIAAMLDAHGLDGSEVVATIPERSRTLVAEKVAINAVMAGCLPEYLPVVNSILRAMTDPGFKFNHLASLGSPWPVVVVNGPIGEQIGLSSGMYVFGPGNRAGMAITRAVSLVLRNCAGAKNEEVQRGQWGHGLRFSCCIAENESTSWEPLHVQRGFDKEQSTVTAVSTYPGSPFHVTINGSDVNGRQHPERMLDSACHSIAYWGGAQWTRGSYVLLIPPNMVDTFVEHGWSKDDVRRYVMENTFSTIADLKYRGAWGRLLTDPKPTDLEIQPGDDQVRLQLFQRNPEYDDYVALASALQDRPLDVLVVVGGGDAGPRMELTIPYQLSTNPVTKIVSAA
jgi:hypothetical protein